MAKHDADRRWVLLKAHSEAREPDGAAAHDQEQAEQWVTHGLRMAGLRGRDLADAQHFSSHPALSN